MAFDNFPITKEFRVKTRQIMTIAFSKAIMDNVSSGV
jgi:hypothetical protein